MNVHEGICQGWSQWIIVSVDSGIRFFAVNLSSHQSLLFRTKLRLYKSFRDLYLKDRNTSTQHHSVTVWWNRISQRYRDPRQVFTPRSSNIVINIYDVTRQTRGFFDQSDRPFRECWIGKLGAPFPCLRKVAWSKGSNYPEIQRWRQYRLFTRQPRGVFRPIGWLCLPKVDQ